MLGENIVRRRPGVHPGLAGAEPLRCSLTGHRPNKLPFAGEGDPRCVDFQSRLSSALELLIWQGYSQGNSIYKKRRSR